MKNMLEQLNERVTPLETKERSLNDIIADAYCERYDIERSELNTSLDSSYKNYRDEQKLKISLIAKNLDRDIKEFQTNSNRYTIPFNVAEVIHQYIVEDSTKGSFVSKIKNNKLNQVKNEEKLEFVHKAFDRVLESCRDSEDREYCEILRKEYVEMIDVLQKANEKKEKLIEISNKSINKNIKTIYNIKETDGFVKFGTENGEKKILSSKYENSLTTRDAEILVDAYSLMIEALNDKWSKIVDEYVKQKRHYVLWTTFEDAEKLIDLELSMLKDALEVTYREKDTIKDKISEDELKKIAEFLGRDTNLKENKITKTLKEIESIAKNDQ